MLGRYESGLRHGRTIVAMHGVTDNAPSLCGISAHYGDRWRVVALDTLGHGLSPQLNAKQLENPIKAMVRAAAREVADIAAQTVQGQVVLIGHSLGGAICAAVAAQCPSAVSALVLEDPALLTDQQAQMYAADAERLVARQDLVTSHVGEAIVELIKLYPNWPAAEYGPWAQGKVQVDRALVRSGVVGKIGREILERLEVPTLLVTGDADDVLFGSAGLEEVERLGNPHIQSALISHASHTVRRDQSKVFYRIVDAFLETNVPPAEAVAPYLDPALVPAIAGIPEQTTWDLGALRGAGEALLSAEPEFPGFEIRDDAAPGISDSEPAARFRVVTPMGEADAAGAETADDAGLPVIAIHGGGFVAGAAKFDDQRNVELSELFGGVTVYSPDYRLAPEHPYPAGMRDCLALYRRLTEGPAGREAVLLGDSAGSGLAVQMLTALINQGEQPAVRQLVLLEPCIDPWQTSRSFETNSAGPVWTRQAGEVAWQGYLRDAILPQLSQEIASQFPPTLVVVNPADPLRDEGINLARRLADSGVYTELHMLAGTYHGSLSIPETTVWARVKETIADFSHNINRRAQ